MNVILKLENRISYLLINKKIKYFEMLKFFIPIFLCFVTFARSDEGVNWVLLVAGSNEYYNYRHQVNILNIKY